MDEDEADERTTVELPAGEPVELDEDERAEVLLEWAPVVGYG